jgi:ankyrin repeat protein
MILMGNRTAVEFLLRKGANPNGGKGLTPLSCIIHRDDSQSDYKNTEIIQSLKQYGADFTNIKNYDNSKESLLFTAVCLSKKGLVEYLLSNAVGVEVQTESYMTLPRDNMISQITPLHMAAFLGYSPTIVEQLLVSGANPLKADSYGNTALHLVAYPDPRYMSALPPGSHLTQNERGTRIVSFQKKRDEMLNAVIIKSEGRRGCIMELLIKRVPDPSLLNTCVNHEGDTILHKAVCNRDANVMNSVKLMVRQLIVAGASATILNKAGKTAYELASDEIKHVIDKAKKVTKTSLNDKDHHKFFKTNNIQEQEGSNLGRSLLN